MANDSNEFGAFLSGLVFGGLVGAAAALLLAPQSGEETRTYIREKSIELKDTASDRAAEARSQAETTYVETRQQAEARLAEARQQAEKIVKDAQARADELRQQGQVVLEEQRTKLEDAIDAGKKAVTKKGADAEESA